MGKLRVHLLFTDGEDVIGTKKLKAENYNLEEYDDADLNQLESQIIHEVRIAQEQLEEDNLRHEDDDDDMWESDDES